MEQVWVRIAAADDESSARKHEQAITALLGGRCGDFTGSEPVVMDCETGATLAEELPELPRRPPRGQFIAGLTLGAVGTASLLSGYGLLVARKSAGDNWLSNPQSREEQQTWVRLGTGILVTGSAGSALLVSAMPLILPYKKRTPWWGWLTGGLGLASGGVAIALAVTAGPKRADSCRVSGPDPQPCVDRARQTDLALLLGATAAPLITIPLVYLFRKSDKRSEAGIFPTMTAASRGATFGVHGVF